MKNREDQKYIIKVFEAQWDIHHTESVKPFFRQLQRECEDEGHDALFSYYVFQGASSLRDALNHFRHDKGIDGRLKIGYISAHGEKDRLKAVGDISRVRLRNLILNAPVYDGFFFGSCDFANRKTAELLLNTVPTLKWIAGYSKWTPWLEGTICDVLFFKILFGGIFVRPTSRARWEYITKPEEAAAELYDIFQMARDLRFSLFYRDSSGEIRSTLEDYEKEDNTEEKE